MSPLTTDADFISEKNQETKQPVYLYRVEIDDVRANDLFRTSDKEDINYYKDVNTAQTYTATSVEHQQITENEQGKVDSMAVTFGNVSQEMIAYALQNDALRGRKITIRQTFRKFLAGAAEDSPSAHVEYVYIIDRAIAKGTTMKFWCVSPMDVLNVPVPTRMYRRNHCGWRYKGYGCWTLSGTIYAAPTGWRTTGVQLYTGERIGRATIPLYGGIATDRDDDDASPHAVFAPVPIPQLTKANGTLRISLRTDYPSRLGANQQIELSSAGHWDTEEWYLPYATLAALAPAVSDAWQQYDIPLVSCGDTGGGLDVESGINFIRWYNWPTDGNDQTLQWKEASILVAGGLSEAEVRLNRPINMHGLTKVNGSLVVDLKCDVPAKIDTDSQIELSSSFTLDTNEWALIDLTSLGITNSWVEYTLPLSGFTTTGGDMDVTQFRYMRVYCWSTDGSPIVLSFRNPRIEFPGAIDECNRTKQACKRHNNLERYGGFPSIAGRTLTRGG